jgi:hypothetical protein
MELDKISNLQQDKSSNYKYFEVSFQCLLEHLRGSKDVPILAAVFNKGNKFTIFKLAENVLVSFGGLTVPDVQIQLKNLLLERQKIQARTMVSRMSLVDHNLERVQSEVY